MVSGPVSFSLFALVGFIMLVLSGTSFSYLLRVKNKSRSSWMLIWFFLCVLLSALATILTNSGTAWDWAFAPSQDAFLILGGVSLVRFAYFYPEKDQPREARSVQVFFGLIALGALSYSVSFAIQYLSNIAADINENQNFYLLTPATIVGVVIIFLRRSYRHSYRYSLALQRSRKSFLQHLLWPDGQPARALRNYALGMSLSFIPAVVTIIKWLLPEIISYYLFNFGVVMAISAVMLVYLNFAPEPTTLNAKLVGITLVTVFLTIGLTGVEFIFNMPRENVHDTIIKFMRVVLISSALILFVLPFFYKASILNPLQKLLLGIKTANQGNLDTHVEVEFEDEIGFLTHSFNRMVKSLDDSKQILKGQSIILEKEVAERTTELSAANEQLVREINERKSAEELLDLQLEYQKALANCSQALLTPVDNDHSQFRVLNQALEYLRIGAQASRASILRFFEDPELGKCMGILAETCAPGIAGDIDNPGNQKVPVATFPHELVDNLALGQAYGGITEEVFSNSPSLKDHLLHKVPPLFSFKLFPILFHNQLWGYTGFDDCLSPRIWSEAEIAILATASDMIGNTIQRWKIQTQLRETLNDLEERVQIRTSELKSSNTKLFLEIQQRQLAQRDLETRLSIEQTLENISSRLLDPSNDRENIRLSLQDLGQIMNASRIFLVDFDLRTPELVQDYLDWRRPDVAVMNKEEVQKFIQHLIGFRDRLRTGETIYISDTANFPSAPGKDVAPLRARGLHSLVLSPLIIDNRIHSVLGCSNFRSSPNEIDNNMHVMELVVGMLKSLKLREYMVETLEEQVAERTHQFTSFLDMAIVRNQGQNLADILQPILHSITHVAEFDAASVHIIDEKKGSMDLVAQLGIPYDSLHAIHELRLEERFSTWLDEVDLSEFIDGPVAKPAFLSPLCIEGFQSFITSRLTTGSKVLGLICCYRVSARPFSPFQATFLIGLGELLGIIVENHRLRTEAEELAVVEERQRLAREIHDAVSQSVYSLSLFARSAKDSLNRDNTEKLNSILTDMENVALQSMREMRLLLYQLRELVQNEDLTKALNTRFNQVENRLGIQVDHEIETGVYTTSTIRHEFWRITMEALNNVVKHAHASLVFLKIHCEEGNLWLNIKDNGVGFNVDQDSQGMGLKNIMTRTERLGGKVDIISEVGQGTQIIVMVPNACLDPGEGVLL